MKPLLVIVVSLLALTPRSVIGNDAKNVSRKHLTDQSSVSKSHRARHDLQYGCAEIETLSKKMHSIDDSPCLDLKFARHVVPHYFAHAVCVSCLSHPCIFETINRWSSSAANRTTVPTLATPVRHSGLDQRSLDVTSGSSGLISAVNGSALNSSSEAPTNELEQRMTGLDYGGLIEKAYGAYLSHTGVIQR